MTLDLFPVFLYSSPWMSDVAAEMIIDTAPVAPPRSSAWCARCELRTMMPC